MKRLLYPLATLLLLAAMSGCASMSKKDCENADWQSLGYSDGSRGVHYSNLEKRRESCSKYQIVPDDTAYRAGWEQGIRRYCTADTGYRIGSSGRPYPNICPPDVQADFLSGWQQGVRQYCTPDNALRQGLAGYPYHGVCPADVAPVFSDFYRLGHDVRQARAGHQNIERQLERTERALAAEQNPQRHRELLHELARLRHEEYRSDAMIVALEACMSDDWFDAGYRDGDAGQPNRTREIAAVCRNYGIRADRPGYRDGWLQGNSLYCTYDSGLYVGQNNQQYLGVCSGYGHMQFWRGYQRGRQLFEADRYEAHPRPVRPPVHRAQPPARMQQPPAMQQPQRAVQPPVRMQQPQRAVQPPVRKAQPPVRMQQPQRAVQPPVRKAQPPVRMQQPQRAVQPPVKKEMAKPVPANRPAAEHGKAQPPAKADKRVKPGDEQDDKRQEQPDERRMQPANERPAP